MKDFFPYTKLFTILISIFYISGLVGCFFEIEILILTLVFITLCISIWFLNLDLKKAIVLFLIFFLGLIRANQSLKLSNPFLEIISNNVTIYGQVVSACDVSRKTDKIKFYLKAKNAQISKKEYKDLDTKFLVSLDLNENILNEISIGDWVKLKGKLRHPITSFNPYQFDYKKYLLNNDVENILYADKFEKIKEPDFKSDKWFFVLKKFEKMRNDILEKHSKYIKSPRLEILGGIVFGSETINPDDEVKENFKNSGLLHLLAASGLNVALIYGIWWWLASLVRFPYNASILTGAVFVVLYTFMTGFPPSILRASIMLLFVLFGKIIDRNTNSLALIFFAGFLILLFSPKMLFDVGFQLSFVVTIGLVVCIATILSKFEKLDKKYKEKYKKSSRIKKYFTSLFMPSTLASVVAIPLVAQLCVVPLQMHYFNNFTPFSLFANIAVIPFIGILSFIGFLSSILALIPILNEPMIYIFDFVANPLLGLLIKISDFFSSFKYSLITTFSLNIFQIGMFWMIGLAVVLNLKNNFKNKKEINVLAVLILMFFVSFVCLNNNNFEINMFDLGSADGFLIKTPKNKYIMIDTGKKAYKSISSAQTIINKYLKNERIKELELLIVTHFDLDHCGGVIDILENNKVNKVIIQNENIKSQISAEIFKYLKENKINYEVVKNNEIIYKEDNLNLKTYNFNFKNENESSIITLINYKNKNMLFMGDSGVLAYEKLKKYLPEKIEILKIGHHGAKNSIDNKMIEEMKLKYALISAGINDFYHPHYETLKVLEDSGVRVISSKNYGFSKIVLKDEKENIFYFDEVKKTLKPLIFEAETKEDFSKSDFIKKLVKESVY